MHVTAHAAAAMCPRVGIPGGIGLAASQMGASHDLLPIALPPETHISSRALPGSIGAVGPVVPVVPVVPGTISIATGMGPGMGPAPAPPPPSLVAPSGVGRVRSTISHDVLPQALPTIIQPVTLFPVDGGVDAPASAGFLDDDDDPLYPAIESVAIGTVAAVVLDTDE